MSNSAKMQLQFEANKRQLSTYIIHPKHQMAKNRLGTASSKKQEEADPNVCIYISEGFLVLKGDCKIIMANSDTLDNNQIKMKNV